MLFITKCLYTVSIHSGWGSVQFKGGCYDIIGLPGNTLSLMTGFPLVSYHSTLSISWPHLFLHRCIVSNYRKFHSIRLYIHTPHPCLENTDSWPAKCLYQMRVNPILSNYLEAGTHADANKVFFSWIHNSSNKMSTQIKYNSVFLFSLQPLGLWLVSLGDCIICSYLPDLVECIKSCATMDGAGFFNRAQCNSAL